MPLLRRMFDTRQMLGGEAAAQELPSTRTLLQTTLAIAWPSTLESFLIALVGMVDTIMVAQLGAYAIAAVGLTTQPKFLGLCVFLALNVAVSSLVARRKGEEDREAANRVLKQALAITVGLAVVFSIVFVTFAEPMLRITGTNEDTHAAATVYLRIIMGGMMFHVVTMVINAAQRGVGNTKIAMRTNIISNLVNICFNYLLINGIWFFPRWEVSGAAVATVLGTIAAFAMSLYSVSHPEGYLYLGLTKGFQLNRETLQSIGSLSSSTLVEQIFVRVGFLLSAAIVARLGTVAFAAHQSGMNLLNLSFALGDGLSVAAVALVGQSLGAGRKDLAQVYGHLCQRIGMIFAAILSVVFLTMGRPLFSLFSDDPVILNYGVQIARVTAVIVFLQITTVIFSGSLRGAGDVKYVAMVSLICISFVRPLAGYLLCYPLGLGLLGVWLSVALDQGLRALFMLIRFAQGRWVDIRI